MKTSRIISSAGMYTSALCEVQIIAHSVTVQSILNQAFKCLQKPKTLGIRIEMNLESMHKSRKTPTVYLALN